jgi:hypothetical protein
MPQQVGVQVLDAGALAARVKIIFMAVAVSGWPSGERKNSPTEGSAAPAGRR